MKTTIKIKTTKSEYRHNVYIEKYKEFPEEDYFAVSPSIIHRVLTAAGTNEWDVHTYIGEETNEWYFKRNSEVRQNDAANKVFEYLDKAFGTKIYMGYAMITFEEEGKE